MSDPAPVHLRQAGVSVVLAPASDGVPALLHWGADLGLLEGEDLAAFAELRRPGVPHSALDEPRYLSVVPDAVSGFTGTPAVEMCRVDGDASAWTPRFRDWVWRLEGTTVTLAASDDECGLAIEVWLEVTREGLVRSRSVVTNTGTGRAVVIAVRSVLPVPAEASELLDLTGRWCGERIPQRRNWQQGAWVRQGRHGRTGHDATLLLVAGTPGFTFRDGRVWGVHVAWSGDHLTYAERTPEGECLLGGGELLGPGEVILADGESYTTPWLVGSTSTRGLDGLSARLHELVRQRGRLGERVRPVLLNTWEAAYFDQDLGRLTALADAAGQSGVERFVLDDGWFLGRRSDRRGLGDWQVDPEMWPDGLHPLVDHVRGLGMDFGLWVEPEMVNSDSQTAREHPDWILRGRDGLPATWRHQQVLDLQQPAAYAHVRDALVALLDEYDIAFLKWDHNRDLIDVAHAGRPAVHGQTLAFYRLLDELRGAHPALEIESCASGGGRVDLGVLERTDRVWPSDTIDAIERQRIQRWTSLLVPPEMLGTHIGGPVAHTTGRTHRLAYRAATALLGHLGIEWDLTTLTPPEREELAAWVTLHKQVRHLIRDGVLVRPDHPDPAIHVTGVVAQDGDEAVFVVATTGITDTQSPYPVVLSGLHPGRSYHLRCVTPAGDQHGGDLGESWLAGPGLNVLGSVLATAGVRLPVMPPETAQVLYVEGHALA